MKCNHSYLSKTCTILVLSSIITVSISGCGLFKKDKEVLAPPLVKSSNIEFKTEKAKIKDIEKAVNLLGVCVPKDTIVCSFSQRGGFLKSLNFKTGVTVKKGDILAELDTDEISSQIEEQTLNLKKFQLRHQALLEDPNARETEKQASELDVQAQETALQKLKTEEKKHKLVAPVDGYIIQRTKFSIGDRVNGFEAIYTLAQTDELKFLCEKTDASNSVTVEMDATIKFTNQSISGKVTSLDEKIEDKEKAVNCIALEPSSSPKGVTLGDKFSAYISVGKKENVLVVPRKAIKYYESQPYIRILENGTKVEKFVDVGLFNTTDAEILSGIQEDDDVIIN